MKVATRRSQAGFTLLEAIVAMVVFTIGAMALYGWLSANLITLERVRAQQQREAAVASALDLIRRSNPMAEPNGNRTVGPLTVTWAAKLVEPARYGVDQGGQRGLYAVGLYRLDVEVIEQGRVLQQMQVRQVGWKQVVELQQ